MVHHEAEVESWRATIGTSREEIKRSPGITTHYKQARGAVACCDLQQTLTEIQTKWTFSPLVFNKKKIKKI